MPSVKTIELNVRGQRMQLEIPDRAPDDPAPPLEDFQLQLDMLCLALIALEDPRVDGVLRAFGFRVCNAAGDPILDFQEDPG